MNLVYMLLSTSLLLPLVAGLSRPHQTSDEVLIPAVQRENEISETIKELQLSNSPLLDDPFFKLVLKTIFAEKNSSGDEGIDKQMFGNNNNSGKNRNNIFWRMINFIAQQRRIRRYLNFLRRTGPYFLHA